MPVRKTIDKPAAEDLAVKALTFLAADESRLRRFLDLSGLRPAAIRTAAAETGFLAGILDYVAADEALLLAMAEAVGATPETIMAARQLLSPGDASD